jgi:hypothetical protein
MTMEILKGFRTVLVGLAVAVVPVVTQYLGAIDWAIVLPFPWNFVASGVVMIVMRALTNTPLFQK